MNKKKNKSSRAASGRRTQFLPKITPDTILLQNSDICLIVVILLFLFFIFVNTGAFISLSLLVSFWLNHWGKWNIVTHDGIVRLNWKRSRFYLQTFRSLSRRDPGLIMWNLSFVWFTVLKLLLINQKMSHFAPGYPMLQISNYCQSPGKSCTPIYDFLWWYLF